MLKMHEPEVRPYALRWVATLSDKGSSELYALAASNPSLLKDWAEELTRCRAQWQWEIELVDSALENLRQARTPSKCRLSA